MCCKHNLPKYISTLTFCSVYLNTVKKVSFLDEGVLGLNQDM